MTIGQFDEPLDRSAGNIPETMVLGEQLEIGQQGILDDAETCDLALNQICPTSYVACDPGCVFVMGLSRSETGDHLV